MRVSRIGLDDLWRVYIDMSESSLLIAQTQSQCNMQKLSTQISSYIFALMLASLRIQMCQSDAIASAKAGINFVPLLFSQPATPGTISS